MSPRRRWLSFERHGGLPPRDDESLALSEDGTFTARRTVGGRAIGSFAGVLPATRLARVRKAVEALSDAEDVSIPTPGHGATETFAAGGQTIELGSNDAPPRPWRSLVQPVRSILEDEVVDQPRSAILLVADVRSARLEHAGSEPIELDLGSVQVRVVRMGGDDAVRDRWQSRPTGGRDWVTAGSGWTNDLSFDHGLHLELGDWLQVRVEVAIREDAERRAGRLYVPVIPDA